MCVPAVRCMPWLLRGEFSFRHVHDPLSQQPQRGTRRCWQRWIPVWTSKRRYKTDGWGFSDNKQGRFWQLTRREEKIESLAIGAAENTSGEGRNAFYFLSIFRSFFLVLSLPSLFAWWEHGLWSHRQGLNLSPSYISCVVLVISLTPLNSGSLICKTDRRMLTSWSYCKEGIRCYKIHSRYPASYGCLKTC